MKEIKLSQRHKKSKNRHLVALVDDADFEWLNKWKWRVRRSYKGTYYAIRTERINGKMFMFLMHRVILGLTDPKIFGDHEDHDGLNNQRYNIRPATCAQNNTNVSARLNTSSVYKGVYFLEKYTKWRAYINFGGVRKHIGYFKNEAEAARAYNLAAKEFHGEFARPNKVPA